MTQQPRPVDDDPSKASSGYGKPWSGGTPLAQMPTYPTYQAPLLPQETPPPPPPTPWGAWHTVGWSVACMVGMLLFQLFAGAIAVVVAMLLRLKLEGGAPMSLILFMGGMSSLVVIPMVLKLIQDRQMMIGDYLAWRSVSWLRGAAWVVGAVILMLGTGAILSLLEEPEKDQEFMQSVVGDGSLPILMLIAVVILAPLTEEILFRGFMFRGLAASKVGGVRTVVITAALFAMIHVQYSILGILLMFVMGLLLGTARLRTGSLPLCMVIHGSWNLLVVVVQSLAAQGA